MSPKSPLFNLGDTRRFSLMSINTEEPISVVIDCDAGNEIDDQFALAWTLLNPHRLKLEAIYAAPYTNDFFANQDGQPTRVSHAAIGMQRSYDEIKHILALMNKSKNVAVFKGATDYLKDCAQPQSNPAVEDLIARARQAEKVLHVVSIAAPTNIATALLLAPDIASKIHVLWLGGHSFDWHDNNEFNLMQDIAASRVLLDSGVALTLFPCMGVTNTLASSIPEISHYLTNTSKIGDYLAKLAPTFSWIGFASRKVIWDIANIGYLINPSWFTTQYVASPILNDNMTWSFDPSRHIIRVVKFIERDNLFEDMFRRLQLADQSTL